jgi:hypothetical protein
LATAVLAALLASAPALAQQTSGTGLVKAKDLKARTATLDGDRILHVTDRTAITGADGGRLTLETLPVAERAGGGFKASGDASVHFSAFADDGRLLADSIRVLGSLVE